MRPSKRIFILLILILLAAFTIEQSTSAVSASASSRLSGESRNIAVEANPRPDKLNTTVYSLSNPQTYQITYTHTVENSGSVLIPTLDVWLLVRTDTNAQSLIDFQPNPKPIEYLYDRWGQKVAHYSVENIEAGSQLQFTWTAKAIISDIEYAVNPGKVGSIDQVPKEIKEKYTVDEGKYNIYSPVVQQAAKQAAGNKKNLYHMVKDIYDFVINNLEYKFEGGWDDAATVLARGSGSCSEYSFVFIALCRANGIPARYIGGTRYRGDGYYEDKTFHRAVEVYLPGYDWVPVDVSLADTKSSGEEYLFQLKNDFFVVATAGGRSELLSWCYHSYCKWDHTQVDSSVKSTRLVQWVPE